MTGLDSEGLQAADPEVVMVTVPVCAPCLSGAGGECHSPGCAWFICPALDDEQAERLRFHAERTRADRDRAATDRLEYTRALDRIMDGLNTYLPKMPTTARDRLYGPIREAITSLEAAS